MKNNIELEKYLFVGDSNVNEVICIKSDGTRAKCTQTALIEALSKNNQYIKGGSKLKLGSNNGTVSYLIDYGTSEEKPKQLIKITFNEENLLNGDPNALVIDSICQRAITVRKNNIKKVIISGTAAALAAVGIAGVMIAGISYASKEEQKYQNDETSRYQQWLEEKKREKALGLSMNGDIPEISEAELMGKSL